MLSFGNPGVEPWDESSGHFLNTLADAYIFPRQTKEAGESIKGRSQSGDLIFFQQPALLFLDR